jgi:hypothetical protein
MAFAMRDGAAQRLASGHNKDLRWMAGQAGAQIGTELGALDKQRAGIAEERGCEPGLEQDDASAAVSEPFQHTRMDLQSGVLIETRPIHRFLIESPGQPSPRSDPSSRWLPSSDVGRCSVNVTYEEQEGPFGPALFCVLLELERGSAPADDVARPDTVE